MALRTFTAYLDEPARIRLILKKPFFHPEMTFTLASSTGEKPLRIEQSHQEEEGIIYQLSSPYPLSLTEEYTIYDQDRNATELGYGKIVRSQVFEQAFTYDGTNLGSHYTPSETHFAFWAPISKKVFLILEGTPYAMKKEEKGVWETTVSGDLDGASYHYLHNVNGQWLSVHDPYALSSQANSGDSYVINRKKLDTPRRASTQIPPSQAIIYEMSVRDFSQQAELGFQHPSQFLGLTESPKLNEMAIGMDYIKQLGVTHIQLMPVYDFGSVDECYPQAVYNWGYDPVQYNVPEGSFSSKPNDPYARISELQTAIQAYHDANISVIMDVVYNHVYHAEEYAFERIVPGYFYRYNENDEKTDGTFCGNDVASERSMVRHYIIQSLKQWTSLYGFDGFRFDLMGILDIHTMQEIERELRTLHPHIYLYGEGWKMDTGLDSHLLAHQYHADLLPSYAFFNDNYRDTIKTILSNPQELVNQHLHEKVQHLLTGSRFSHFISPEQSLNYIECHDNATAFDYFHIEQPDWSIHQQKRAASFGLQLILISQGMAFLHSGQEFFRTKNNIDNTYNLPDTVNHLDWMRAYEYREHIQFIRELIAFRKQHPMLTQPDYQSIQQTCDFHWLTEYVLRYTITSNEKQIQCIINFSHSEFLYEKEENQVIRFTFPPHTKESQEILIAGQSICLLESEKE